MLLTRLFGRRREAPAPAGARQSPAAAPARAGTSNPPEKPAGAPEISRPKVVNANAGFDPYNSGAFVAKGGAWERVNRR